MLAEHSQALCLHLKRATDALSAVCCPRSHCCVSTLAASLKFELCQLHLHFWCAITAPCAIVILGHFAVFQTICCICACISYFSLSYCADAECIQASAGALHMCRCAGHVLCLAGAFGAWCQYGICLCLSACYSPVVSVSAVPACLPVFCPLTFPTSLYWQAANTDMASLKQVLLLYTANSFRLSPFQSPSQTLTLLVRPWSDSLSAECLSV